MENVMKSKHLIYFFLIALMYLSLTTLTKSQGFKDIILMQSKCEDVKRILNVKECTYPQSKYEKENFHIRIQFTKKEPTKNDKICWNVPAGTVLSLKVSYKMPISLSEFEYPLKYVKGPVNDIFTMIYENKERSIEAHVINNYITSVFYLPTEADYKKFSYSCNSPDEGDNVELPDKWIECYWNISPKEEEKILKYSIEVLSESVLNEGIYIVYYYKNKNDKIIGFEKAKRAKKFLENNGLVSEKIKIFNGGREKKSKIVLYPVRRISFSSEETGYEIKQS